MAWGKIRSDHGEIPTVRGTGSRDLGLGVITHSVTIVMLLIDLLR